MTEAPCAHALSEGRETYGEGGEECGGPWIEVPKKSLKSDQWQRAGCVWDESEPIYMKEGHAALIAARHIVRGASNGWGRRHPILGDHQSLVAALSKGQAEDPGLLRICRKWACLQLAGYMNLAYRWIPSEFNPADSDSPRWEEPGTRERGGDSGASRSRRAAQKSPRASSTDVSEGSPPASRGLARGAMAGACSFPMGRPRVRARGAELQEKRSCWQRRAEGREASRRACDA